MARLFLFSQVLCMGLALVWSASVATAQTTLKEPTYKDLVGVWQSVHHRAIYWHRDTVDETTLSFELDIQEQDGPLLQGELHWRSNTIKGPDHDGVRETNSGREPFIGMLGFSGETITFVEHPDTGVLQGRLVNGDIMELLHFEAGRNAAIARYMLVRLPSQIAGITDR